MEVDMADRKVFERNRVIRGRPYSLKEFQEKYGLNDDVAGDLFARFGPSAIELDLLMSAKARKPSFHQIAEGITL
jgi:hypothetical protein